MAVKVIKGKNFTVTIELDALAKISNVKKIVNSTMANKLGNSILRETKNLVGVGKSPVKGKGRFPAYAKQRKGSGYPDTPDIRRRFPSKKTRPVNLELSGKFLKALGFKKTDGGIDFGWIDPSEDIKKLIDAHNNGLNKNVPQRKVIPNADGEDYTASIRRLIKDIYLQRIRAIIRS